jgi:N-acetylglucosamine kinase-like BadF-type ATPase
MSVVLAVDGGNSKTDLALVSGDGEVLGVARGPLSSPHHLGLDGCVAVLEQLLAEAGGDVAGQSADVGVLLLAGIDFVDEESRLQQAVESRGWVGRTIVGNDTFAVLRAGTERGWGVAVVCGAGINCLGVAPDGRHVRFPALGEISGDWGGGRDVGMAALGAAARGEDGRGPRTSLERLVPAHFGLESPHELVRAIHVGRFSEREVIELAPVVLAAAADDAVAAEIVDRLAAEVVALARAALTRLDLIDEPAHVVLGGGLLQSGDVRLLRGIETRLHELGPQLLIDAAVSPPIVGSALLGLDELRAGPEAQARLRRELGDAVDRFETREEVS